MSTRTDRLSRTEFDHRDRLNFVQGLLLDSESFKAEQLYHRGRLARALAYLFGTGTVAGLEVTYPPDGPDELRVAPGLAIDPLGRLIEIPRLWCLDLEPWFAAQRDADLSDGWIAEGPAPADPQLVADVFVRFAECERRLSPAFATGPYDALDSVSPSRLRDGFELALVIRTETQLRRADIDAEVAEDDTYEIPSPRATERWEELLTMDPPERLEAMRNDILSGWREGTEFWQNDRPPRLPEHLPANETLDPDDPLEVGRDPTSVLLARVRIPVEEPTDAEPPTRAEAGTPTVDNMIRRFIYAPGILTRIVLPEPEEDA